MRFRYATAADVVAYYGELPRQTLKAVVGVIGEEPVAIAGIAREGDVLHAFSEFKPGAPLKTRAVVQMFNAVKAMCREADLPVFAICLDNPKLAERMGFKLLDDKVYMWPN